MPKIGHVEQLPHQGHCRTLIVGFTISFDRFFAVGGISVDRFAGTSNASYEGQKLVRLPGGDVVVAGLVPAGAGAQQLGIVRYSPSGRRVTWPARWFW